MRWDILDLSTRWNSCSFAIGLSSTQSKIQPTWLQRWPSAKNQARINYSSSSLRSAAQWSKQSSSMRLWTQISGTVWRKKFKPRPMFLGSMIFSWNRILGSSLQASSYRLPIVHSQSPAFSKDHSLNPVQKRRMQKTKILTVWTSVTTSNNKKRISA